jgi:hypothetical protein
MVRKKAAVARNRGWGCQREVAGLMVVAGAIQEKEVGGRTYRSCQAEVCCSIVTEGEDAMSGGGSVVARCSSTVKTMVEKEGFSRNRNDGDALLLPARMIDAGAGCVVLEDGRRGIRQRDGDGV